MKLASRNSSLGVSFRLLTRKTASWRPQGFQLTSLPATRRHPEARVLSTPWEPKEIDLVRRARKLSMLRHQAMQAMAFGIDENDHEDDCYSSSTPSRKGSTFEASRNPANILGPGNSATPVYPGASRCSSAKGNANQNGPRYITRGDDTISQAITSGAGSKDVTDALALDRSHSHGITANGYIIGKPRGHSYDSANSDISMGHGYTCGNSPPHSLSTTERFGLSAWAAKFGSWKAERKGKSRGKSRSNSRADDEGI